MRLPVAASSACTTSPGVGKYMMPFDTSGVASFEPFVIAHDHASARLFTLVVLMVLSGL